MRIKLKNSTEGLKDKIEEIFQQIEQKDKEMENRRKKEKIDQFKKSNMQTMGDTDKGNR